jgi:hypothetical protein
VKFRGSGPIRAWQPGDLRRAASSTLPPGDANEASHLRFQFNGNEKCRVMTRGI